MRSIGAATFTSAKFADMELRGFAGEQVPLNATAAEVAIQDPLVSAALSQLLTRGEPLGVLLPVNVIGEYAPKFVICTGRFAVIAAKIEQNAEVRVWGQQSGMFVRPSRITCADCPD